MFIDEAKLAAQLNHNNIIHIYDLGKIQSSYYIAMEYIDGYDLKTILKQGAGARSAALGRDRALRRFEDRRGARLRAPQARLRRQRDGPRAPRRLAAERAHLRGRRHQALRLRHRQGRVEGVAHAGRRAQGQAAVHVARAGLGTQHRQALRHLRAGHGALRDAHRAQTLHRRQRAVDPRAGARGARHAAVAVQRRGDAADRRHRAQGAAEGSRQSLSDRRRDGSAISTRCSTASSRRRPAPISPSTCTASASSVATPAHIDARCMRPSRRRPRTN